MRNTSPLLIGLLLPFTMQARILRVNHSVPLGQCQDQSLCFTGDDALQVAVAAALPYDTLHIEPSDLNYGDITQLDKPLVIIGAGYFHGGATGNAGLQANEQDSKVRQVELIAGSEGTRIMGLHFELQFGGCTLQNTSNIHIIRNYFDGVGVFFPSNSTVQDITIAENYIDANIYEAQFAQIINNLTIRNNYIQGIIQLDEAVDEIVNLVISNNTFNQNSTNTVRNAEIAFNVFYTGTVSGNNLTIHDNISATALPAGTNNAVVSMGTVYNTTIGSLDTKWNILSASAYEETGNAPRGMYSGISPYRPSGIANVPAVYALQSSLNTQPGGSVQVTLSTRTNP